MFFRVKGVFWYFFGSFMFVISQNLGIYQVFDEKYFKENVSKLCYCVGWKLKLFRVSGVKRVVEMKGNIKGVIIDLYRRLGFTMRFLFYEGKQEVFLVVSQLV